MGKKSKGFTLLEMTVVLLIIALMAGAVLPNLTSRPQQARLLRIKSDLQVIESALELYQMEQGFYPTQKQGLMALVKPATTEPLPHHFPPGGYLKRLPQDPWGRPYEYRAPGPKQTYALWALGPPDHPEQVVQL